MGQLSGAIHPQCHPLPCPASLTALGCLPESRPQVTCKRILVSGSAFRYLDLRKATFVIALL